MLLFNEALSAIDSPLQSGKLRPDPPSFQFLLNDAMKTEVEVGALANNCLRLVSVLTSHVDGLAKIPPQLQNEDQAGSAGLRSSLAESLTALAEMYDLMSRISPEPLATEYRRRCIVDLMRAVEVVHGLGHDNLIAVGLGLAVRGHELG